MEKCVYPVKPILIYKSVVPAWIAGAVDRISESKLQECTARRPWNTLPGLGAV